MKKALFQIIFLGITCTAAAQVKIGDNPSSIHPDAVLETESANKGLLLPRVTLISSTDSAPLSQHVAGMIVYNTANITGLPSGFYYNNGTKWIGLSASDMGAVLSVYGRTGTIVAENGDYTTALVPDTPDKRYQTDDQFLFNDATSSIQTQLNAKETAIALGNVSQYYRGDKVWAVLDKNAVGLPLVDNTADIDKPISTPTQAALDLKAPLASPNLTGLPTAPTAAPGTSSNQIATTEFVQNIAGTKIEDRIIDGVTDKAPSQNAVYDGLAVKAPLASPNLTGLPTAPTAAPGTSTNQIATTEFVQGLAGTKIEDRITDAVTDKAPSQNAVYDALTLKANLDSPVFTGIPELPSHTKATTQNVWDNSDKIATTAYVHNMTTGKIQNTIMDEVLDSAPTQNAVYDALALKAPLASPNLTGLPTAPTAAPGTSTNQIATTEFVQGLAGTKIEDQILDAVTDKAPSQNAVYDALTLKANLDSPVFTGVPSLPTDAIAVTQPVADDSRKIATTAYVKSITAGKIQDAITDDVTDSAPTQNAVYDALELKAPLASPNLTGLPTAPTAAPGTSSNQIATTEFVQGLAGTKIEDQILDAVTDKAPSQNAVFDALTLKANLDSPVFTGIPSLPTDAIAVTQPVADDSRKIATTAYVKSITAGKIQDAITDDVTDSAPTQNAVYDALTLKAPLASPSLTGIPTAPTAAPGTSSNQIATTEFVQGLAGTKIEDQILDAVTDKAPSQNAVYDALTLKANLDSPIFSGIPSLPADAIAVTQPVADDSRKIATTAYVQNIAAGKIQDVITDNVTDSAPTQNAVYDALELKAPVNDAQLTGIPTAPTAVADTSTDQIATTAFVQNLTGDKIEDQITDGVIDKAPSQNAVFDALDLKQDVITLGTADQFRKGDHTLGIFDDEVNQIINSNKNIPGGIAGVDSSGKIPGHLLPDLTTNQVYVAASQPDMLNIATMVGDIVIRTDIQKTYIKIQDITQPSAMTDFVELISSSTVTSIFGRTGTVSAEIGDYTTGQVTEVTNKRYQTDNQRLFNDATSSIQTQLNAKAPLLNPALTGTPTAPTAAPGTSSIQIATTEFVTNAVGGSTIPDATELAKGKVQLATAAETMAGTVPDKAVHPLGLKSALDLKANLNSPIFTGAPSLPTDAVAITQSPGDNSVKIATTAYVDQATTLNVEDKIDDAIVDKAPSQNAVYDALTLKANLDSPIFTGTPSLPTATTAITQSSGNNSRKIATTEYADAAGAAAVEDDIVDAVTDKAPSQNVVHDALALKANLDSPIFTGAPSLPTAAVAVTQSPGDNSVKIATTAYVDQATTLNVEDKIDDAIVDKAPSQNAVHDALTLKADLDSPIFIGTPSLPTAATAVTQSAGDNSRKIATTAYADAAATQAVEDAIVDAVTDKAPSQNAVHDALRLKANLDSPIFTGTPSLPTAAVAITQSPRDNSVKIATTAYVDQATTLTVEDNIADAVTDKAPSQNAVFDALTLKADLESPIFTGAPSLPTDATAVTQSAHDNSLKIATTAYADAAATQAVEDAIVDAVTDKAPSQNAVHDALVLKANLDSPIFTGTPSLPTDAIAVTQAPGDSSRKIATTQYVDEAATLLVEDTIADTVIDKAPSQNAVYDALTLKADLNSPIFTGTPSLPTATTAVTQSAGDSSEKIATTEFVSNAMQGGSISDATELAPGKVQLATTAETLAGTVANKAVHPLGLKSALDLEANLTGANFTGTVAVGDGASSISIFNAPNDGTTGSWLRQGANSDFILGTKGDMYLNYNGSAGKSLRFFAGAGTTEKMRLSDNGNFGIGTNAPYSLLDVKGNLYTSFHGSNSQHDASERGSRFIGNKSGNTTDGFAGMELEVAATGSGNEGNIHFLTWKISTSVQRRVMTINGDGRVGIGTTNPTAKLEINNGSTVGAIKIVDGSQGVSKVLTSDANGVGTWQAISGSWACYAWNATNPHSDAQTRPVTLTTANSRINGNGGSVSPSNGRIYVPTEGLYRIIVYLDFLNGTLAGGNSCADIQIDTYNSSNTRIYHNCDVVGAAGTKTNGYMQAIVNLPAGGYVVVLTKNNAHEGVISVERITN